MSFSPLPGAWSPPPDVIEAGERASTSYTPGRELCDTTHPQQAIGVGTRKLRDYVVGRWPIRQTYMPGRHRDIVGCARIDVHVDGRGIDFMHVRGADATNTEIAEWLVKNADALGIQEVIWNKTGWFASSGQRWQSWQGPNGWGHSDHSDHVHVSLTPEGASGALPWYRGKPPPAAVEADAEASKDIDLANTGYVWTPTLGQVAIVAGSAALVATVGYLLLFRSRSRKR